MCFGNYSETLSNSGAASEDRFNNTRINFKLGLLQIFKKRREFICHETERDAKTDMIFGYLAENVI